MYNNNYYTITIFEYPHHYSIPYLRWLLFLYNILELSLTISSNKYPFCSFNLLKIARLCTSFSIYTYWIGLVMPSSSSSSSPSCLTKMIDIFLQSRWKWLRRLNWSPADVRCMHIPPYSIFRTIKNYNKEINVYLPSTASSAPDLLDFNVNFINLSRIDLTHGQPNSACSGQLRSGWFVLTDWPSLAIDHHFCLVLGLVLLN